MTFSQAEEYLLGLELFGMRFGLDRMHKLMTVLGLPQRRFASIHVVGTNGKSSTVRFCAAILQRHGLRAGSYTSPHLGSFRERIEVGEEPVSEAAFAAAVQRAAHAAELVNRTQEADDRVTQFEALTAAAYHELARRGVEVAVIEAGLGGRFDATNVIPSKVQVLTTVGLEHTRWLGPTLTDIAEEKLAVVRDGGTLVVGELEPDVFAAAQRVAAEHGATLVATTRGGATFVPISLHKSPTPMVRPADRGIALRAPGRFQRRNFALAARAAEAFLGHALDEDAVERAGAETRIPGRLDVVGRRPLTVYDGAHNPEGARALADSLDDVLGDHRPRVAVIGVLEDKDAAGMLEALLPHVDRVVFTRSRNPRSLPPATLATLAEKLGERPAETVAHPRAAVDRARALAGPAGAVLATGSIYLVADLVRESAGARASML
jgi:dihydrofolate synthase / folylpolyglutamate synthase